MMISRLPYFQSLDSEFGWKLFENIMQSHPQKFWKEAVRCLYYEYKTELDRVNYWLEELRVAKVEDDLETWGRITALTSLTKLNDPNLFLQHLMELNSAAAWRGAATVWTNASNAKDYKKQCMECISAGL